MTGDAVEPAAQLGPIAEFVASSVSDHENVLNEVFDVCARTGQALHDSHQKRGVGAEKGPYVWGHHSLQLRGCSGHPRPPHVDDKGRQERNVVAHILFFAGLRTFLHQI